MKTILQLNSSIFSDGGQSSTLANELVQSLREPGASVIVRDIARDPVPHLDAERFTAFVTSREKRTSGQEQIVAYSDKLIAELKRADVIVLGLPMYNFGLPSTLKAYFDHVARAGVTFKYTEKGSVGLLTGKKAYVVATRGGYYVNKPGGKQTADSQSIHVRDFLAFLGVTDVEFVYAEGLAIGEAQRSAALANARSRIESLTEMEVSLVS